MTRQLDPAARSAVAQVSPAKEKSPGFVPLRAGALQLTAETDPEFVIVIVKYPDAWPIPQLPKLLLVGLTVNVVLLTAVVVIPFRVVVVVPPVVHTRESVVVLTPAEAGFAVTTTVHVAPPPVSAFVEQLSVVIE